MSQSFNKKNILTALILISFAIISRTLIHGQNVETLTATTVLAGALLGPYLGMMVGLLSVIGSDVFIGNTFIFLYTWSAWATIGIVHALWLRRLKNKRIFSATLALTGSGLVSTLFFYLWTNFGVWQIGGLYPHTWAGLVACYVSAIPFLRNQLIGNIFIVPVIASVTLAAYRYLPSIVTKQVHSLQKGE